MSKQLSPEEIVKSYKDAFKEKIIDSRVERHPIGPKKTDLIQIWMTVNKTVYKDIVKHLLTLDKNAHFAISSGYDIKNTIDIVHHFSIYHGKKGNEISINFTTPLPKKNPTIDTITDLIPGALISEKEKQEMLGIKVIKIPQDTRVFISDDFPEDMYPWRKDKKNVDSMGGNLHEDKPLETKKQVKPKRKPAEKGGNYE
jgi:membrane-bound hydrogenase subunit beta